MWKWRSRVLIYSLFTSNSHFFFWSSLHGKIFYMHTKLIRHIKDISRRPTQLLWAVFHQISRQLTAVTSGNLRQTATNHAKNNSISHKPLLHPRSSEAQTSQEAGGYAGGATHKHGPSTMSTYSYRDVLFAILRRTGSYDVLTISLLSFSTSFSSVFSCSMG